jgi:hypothetical protein
MMAHDEQEHRRALSHRKRTAVNALFDYLFMLRHKRVAAYWEARLGEAIVMDEIEVKKTPKELGLAIVHEVAAEVIDAIRTSEAVMVSNPGKPTNRRVSESTE